MLPVFLLPLMVGLIAAWFYRRLIAVSLLPFLTRWVSLFAVAAAAIVFGKALFAWSLFSLRCTTRSDGLLIGRMVRGNYTRLQLSIFPLLVLLVLTDAVYSRPERAMVTDEVLIRATPGQVWPHVLAFSDIPERPDYWIFRLGLPYPTQTTNGGNFAGADRQCMFSDGIVIKERVAEFVPGEKLTFDIVEQPTHPEAYGHITLHRGQFVLRDTETAPRRVRTSWYTLHVAALVFRPLARLDARRSSGVMTLFAASRGRLQTDLKVLNAALASREIE